MIPDDFAFVRQQFNRRFAFALHALLSGGISVVLLLLILTHPLNESGREWLGIARPDLAYITCGLIAAIGLHGVWLVWREKWLNLRRVLFTVHTFFVILFVALVTSFLSSWYFQEVYKQYSWYIPVSPGVPPEFIVLSIFFIGTFVLLTLPIHLIRLIYIELLKRTLQKATAPKVKAKRTEPLFGEQSVVNEIDFTDDLKRKASIR